MATRQDIHSAITRINEVWDNPPARNGRFGNILRSVRIEGIRLVRQTVEFRWPVVAIAGTNGSGKTTVLQLCSSAYCLPGDGRPYKIGDWLRNPLRGDTPVVTPDAKVSYVFWDDTEGYEILYNPQRTRWAYRKRGNPERTAVYVGITAFAPRIERRDQLSVFNPRARRGAVTGHSAEITSSITKILNTPYAGGASHEITLTRGNRREALQQVSRDGVSYSETQMGAGEQKVTRLMNLLEALPNQSLVLLEEPETTLHADAQRGLAWYLMNVSHRKGHQIIIATHSSELYETLPIEARVMLVRDHAQVQAYYNVPFLRAARELDQSVRANGYLILVEDVVAKQLLVEILRRYDRQLLESCAIVAVGNDDDVRRMTIAMREQRLRVIGVRDPDQGDNPAAHLLTLPGDLAPETMLLTGENIARAERLISGLTDAFRRAEVAVRHLNGTERFKSLFALLPDEVNLSKENLADRLTFAWLEHYGADGQQLAARIRTMLEAEQ